MSSCSIPPTCPVADASPAIGTSGWTPNIPRSPTRSSSGPVRSRDRSGCALETTSSTHLHVQVLPWKRATEQDRQDELRSALLVMVLVSLALIGLIAAVATHTTTDYAFAAMQAANLPYAMYVLGYLRPMTAGLLPATALDVGFTIAVFVAVHLTCWFYYFFVQEHLPVARRLVAGHVPAVRAAGPAGRDVHGTPRTGPAPQRLHDPRAAADDAGGRAARARPGGPTPA